MNQPIEVMNIFDNKGYTIDRYTINILFDDGDSFVVSSSESPTSPMGVWSVGEDFISLEDLTDEDVHIGEEIDWEELPREVRKSVIDNFDWS